MSFTADIKRELAALSPATREGCCAMLAGLFDTCGTYAGGKLSFVSENETVAAVFLALAGDACGVQPEVNAAFDPKRERDKVTFSCCGEDARRLAACAEEGRKIDEAVAYLRGAFLGSGSCTVPRGPGKAGYHLEIVFREASAAERLCERLDGLQLLGSTVRRGERTVVYFKSREAIADVLSVAGADSALRKMESIAAAREESNNENRVSNCYAGNADKTAIASAAQVVAFSALRDRGTLAGLPEALQAAAEARMASPTLSLGELARQLGITKSCLNHRLRKLMQIYGEINP